jgi:hypothetical protein
LDVYLYYTLTFILPLIIGIRKQKLKSTWKQNILSILNNSVWPLAPAFIHILNTHIAARLPAWPG